MGFFSSIFGGFSKIGHQSDSQALLSVINSFGPLELAETRAAVDCAFAFITADAETNPMLSEGLVVAITVMMEKKVLNLTKREIGLISALILRYDNIRKSFHGSGNQINQIIANGIPVWLLSFRAVYNLEVLPYARQAWFLLDQKIDRGRYATTLSSIESALYANADMRSGLSEASEITPFSLFVAK